MQQVISPQKIEKEKVSLLYKLTREMLVWFGQQYSAESGIKYP
jgi:hypothetical protein